MVQQGSSKLLLLWHHGRLDAHRLYNFILLYLCMFLPFYSTTYRYQSTMNFEVDSINRSPTNGQGANYSPLSVKRAEQLLGCRYQFRIAWPMPTILIEA